MTSEEIFMDLSKYIGQPFTYDHHKWPKVNIINNADEMNEVLKYGQSLGSEKSLTEHGNLRKTRILRDGWYHNHFGDNTVKMEFGIIENGILYRFLFWNGVEKRKDEINGSYCLKRFRAAKGYQMRKYAVNNNEELQKIKNTIEQPLIALTKRGNIFRNCELHNVFHIDIHSAYPGHACKEFPELLDYFEPLYKGRHEHPENKLILNLTLGAMQSKNIPGNRYPEISRAGTNGTKKSLLELEAAMEKENFVVFCFNTDGLWAMDGLGLGRLYHGKGEGPDMGQWGIDHIADKIRFKSKGSYEYIENGIYHPVVRGKTRLDNIKPRSEWQWGDIYQDTCKVIKYIFDGRQLQEVEINEEETLYNEEW